MSTFAINKNGFWESTDSSGHLFDKPLSEALITFFSEKKANNILDLGCGMGNYTNALLDKSFNCEGFDGNPNTVSLTKGIGKVLDFSIPFKLEKKYDWVLSLEVGEHIPKKYERVFLNNIADHAKNGIVLSWAVPGQNGDGHVNCRSNKYIVKQLKRIGWELDEKAQTELREKATFSWFKNTIMVFRRRKTSNVPQSILSRLFH
jgi:SAM-dependent methyltransferase